MANTERKTCRECVFATKLFCAGSTFRIEAAYANGTLPYVVYSAEADFERFGCNNTQVRQEVRQARTRLRPNQ